MELIVYAVIRGYDYEGENVMKVFKTKVKADKYLEKLKT